MFFNWQPFLSARKIAMAEENRESILADFQSCTGIEDDGECIMILEAANWNLLEAINNVMPQETQTLPSEFPGGSQPNSRVPVKISESAQLPELIQVANTSSFDAPMVAPTAPLSRFLRFTIKHNDKSIDLEVPECETVGTIKGTLCNEFGILPCHQQIIGWTRNNISNDTVLSTLNLPPLSTLTLLPLRQEELEEEKTFTLLITNEETGQEYKLDYPGNASVLRVKQGLHDVTSIPVRNQIWEGWPVRIQDDNVQLKTLGLDVPIHRLNLRHKQISKESVSDLASSDASADEMELVADSYGVEDMFTGEPPEKEAQKPVPLMRDEEDDEIDAISHFISEFRNRYGERHPLFYHGSFTEVLNNTFQKPSKERKPLVIYLHHDKSILAHVFCTQILCSETVVSYLANYYVTWAWDLTFPSNKARFLSTLTAHLAPAAASTIRAIPTDNFPALMVLGRVRSTTEVIAVIPGSVGVDDLMTQLIQTIDIFNTRISTEMQDEEQRLAREMIKQEQDAAYEASLQADRAKEEARKNLEEEKKMRDIAEQIEEEERRQLQAQDEAIQEAIRLSIENQLPDEPAEDATMPITSIRIRVPNGTVLSRRFEISSKLQILLLFVAASGYPLEKYKVLGCWPRRDLTTLDPNSTLENLKLYPKETVMIEERATEDR